MLYAAHVVCNGLGRKKGLFNGESINAGLIRKKIHITWKTHDFTSARLNVFWTLNTHKKMLETKFDKMWVLDIKDRIQPFNSIQCLLVLVFSNVESLNKKFYWNFFH